MTGLDSCTVATHSLYKFNSLRGKPLGWVGTRRFESLGFAIEKVSLSLHTVPKLQCEHPRDLLCNSISTLPLSFSTVALRLVCWRVATIGSGEWPQLVVESHPHPRVGGQGTEGEWEQLNLVSQV